MRLLEEILALQLRVEPVIEHLDGPVQRDVLGDYKVSHTSTDNTPPVKSSVSRHRGLPTAAARGASWSRRRRRNHLRCRGRSPRCRDVVVRARRAPQPPSPTPAVKRYPCDFT